MRFLVPPTDEHPSRGPSRGSTPKRHALLQGFLQDVLVPIAPSGSLSVYDSPSDSMLISEGDRVALIGAILTKRGVSEFRHALRGQRSSPRFRFKTRTPNEEDAIRRILFDPPKKNEIYSGTLAKFVTSLGYTRDSDPNTAPDNSANAYFASQWAKHVCRAWGPESEGLFLYLFNNDEWELVITPGGFIAPVETTATVETQDKKPEKTQCWRVYWARVSCPVSGEAYVKIGRTTTALKERRSALQVAHHLKIEMIASIDGVVPYLESVILAETKSLSTEAGNEWRKEEALYTLRKAREGHYDRYRIPADMFREFEDKELSV